MNFKTYSQAHQDLFTYRVLVKPEGLLKGTFLDIGCCHPTEINNTYALELIGWRGILCDRDPNACALCREQRTAKMIEGDAVALPWAEILKEFLGSGPQVIDYLSLDIDSGTDLVLAALPLADVRFRVITLEHDAYRFGNRPREAMRNLMDKYGYDLVCADVCGIEGMPYEDWFVAPDLVPLAQWERFTCENKRWCDMPL